MRVSPILLINSLAYFNEQPQKICSEIRFNLPTSEMISAKGRPIPRIRNISGNLKIQAEFTFYKKDVDNESLNFIACVKKIP